MSRIIPLILVAGILSACGAGEQSSAGPDTDSVPAQQTPADVTAPQQPAAAEIVEARSLLGSSLIRQMDFPNRAQLEARKLLYQRTSVTDTALGDAQQLGPGSLVRWVDPNDFAGDDGLQAGEVLAIAGPLLTLSEAPDFRGQAEGRIQFTGADGMLLGPPVICTPVAGKARQVTLASVPAGLYVADGDTALRALTRRFDGVELAALVAGIPKPKGCI
jgi:hypothetical protein